MSSTSRQSSPQSLIDELVADLRPVRPVRLAGAYTMALALQFVFVAVAAWFMGVSFDALLPMFTGPMGAVLLLLVASSVSCGLVAVRMSIPGRYVSPWALVACALAPLALAALVFAVTPMPDWGHFVTHFVEGLTCLKHTLIVATPAWILSILFLRRLAPVGPTAVGLFAGLTALLQGALLVQVLCPMAEPFHLALTHYTPLLVVAGMASALSGTLLRVAAKRPS